MDRHQQVVVDPKYSVDNSRSSPNVNVGVVVSAVQRLEITKNNFLNNLLRKLDSRLGQKAVKTISSALPNRQFQNERAVQDKELSSTYRHRTPPPIPPSDRPPVRSELTLRKHPDVIRQIAHATHTKEPPKETPDQRAKTKYSPPPEAISADGSGSASKALVEGSPSDSSPRAAGTMFRGGRKLKERFVVGLSVAAVLFTLLLVVDLQLDLGMSGKHLVASHGRVKYVVQEEGPGSAYNRFRNRLLQKTHRWVARG